VTALAAAVVDAVEDRHDDLVRFRFLRRLAPRLSEGLLTPHMRLRSYLSVGTRCISSRTMDDVGDV